LRHPEFPLPATAHSIQPLVSDSDAPPPAWLASLPRPIVYFTLGTIFNLESGDLFERVLAALARLPSSSVVTVGRDLEPAQFGPLPARVRVERYIPQHAVLPFCSAVVSHAGSGSVMGALMHGLPSVLLPMGADQPHNAARCEQLGFARVLDPVRATPDDIREAVSAVLTRSSYHQAAERLQHEIASLAPLSRAVDLLEELSATRRPIAADRLAH
jgi:MGT family glycosyltransferase